MPRLGQVNGDGRWLSFKEGKRWIFSHYSGGVPERLYCYLKRAPSYLSNVKLTPYSIAQVLKWLNINFSLKFYIMDKTMDRKGAGVKKKNRWTSGSQRHCIRELDLCQPVSKGHTGAGEGCMPYHSLCHWPADKLNLKRGYPFSVLISSISMHYNYLNGSINQLVNQIKLYS